MLEYVPDDSGTAVTNDALVRCSALDAANRVLKAQLAVATALVEQYRVPAAGAFTPRPFSPNSARPGRCHPSPHVTLELCPGGLPNFAS